LFLNDGLAFHCGSKGEKGKVCKLVSSVEQYGEIIHRALPMGAVRSACSPRAPRYPYLHDAKC